MEWKKNGRKLDLKFKCSNIYLVNSFLEGLVVELPPLSYSVCLAADVSLVHLVADMSLVLLVTDVSQEYLFSSYFGQ